MEVRQVKRQVIDNQLLVVLDDESKVAIVASEPDLSILIRALRRFGNTRAISDEDKELRRSLIEGLCELKTQAFGFTAE